MKDYEIFMSPSKSLIVRDVTSNRMALGSKVVSRSTCRCKWQSMFINFNFNLHAWLLGRFPTCSCPSLICQTNQINIVQFRLAFWLLIGQVSPRTSQESISNQMHRKTFWPRRPTLPRSVDLGKRTVNHMAWPLFVFANFQNHWNSMKTYWIETFKKKKKQCTVKRIKKKKKKNN